MPSLKDHPQVIDLTGNIYSRLTVIKFSGVVGGDANWLCNCSCGKMAVVKAMNLKSGTSSSCGCYRIECHVTHGMSRTKTYKSWAAMHNRCTNPSQTGYCNYGGKGITVCRRWRRFENFLKDMGEVPNSMSIERIDNSLGYFPRNCKWATRSEQQRNTSRTVMLTAFGKTQCIQDWADEKGVSRGIITHRIRKLGWSVKDAISTPADYERVNGVRIPYKGKKYSYSKLAKLVGMPRTILYGRITSGETAEQAVSIAPIKAGKERKWGI